MTSSNEDEYQAALILLDFQNEFVKPGGLLHEEVKEAMESIRMLQNAESVLEAARDDNVLVIHAPISLKPGACMEGAFDDDFAELTFDLFLENTWHSEFAEEMKPIHNNDEDGDETKERKWKDGEESKQPKGKEIILSGRRDYSAFLGTDLQSILERHGVCVLFIMGFLSDHCVMETGITAGENNPRMRVIVIEDACAARRQEDHDRMMASTIPLYCETMMCSKAKDLMKRLKETPLPDSQPTSSNGSNDATMRTTQHDDCVEQQQHQRKSISLSSITKNVSHNPKIPQEDSGFTFRVVDNKKVRLDPFIAIDDFFTRFPAAFMDHPHRGFESATFVLPEQEHPDSKLLYYDSTLGQKEASLQGGGLVRMICGKGISHCELVQHEEHLMRAINIWLNYPKDDKYCDPWCGVYQMGTEQMPMSIEDGIRTIVLQGTFDGLSGHCFEPCPAKVNFVHITMMSNRTSVLTVPDGWNAIVYCINGSGYVNGEELSCSEGPADENDYKDEPASSRKEVQTCMKFSVDDEDYDPDQKRSFEIRASKDSAIEIMYFAGEPIGLPMIVFDVAEDGSSGTYVCSNKDEIKEGLLDWIHAKNGFEYRDKWVSPGMQHITKMWDGLEKAAQDRLSDPLTESISGIGVPEFIRDEATHLVKSIRHQRNKHAAVRASASGLLLLHHTSPKHKSTCPTMMKPTQARRMSRAVTNNQFRKSFATRLNWVGASNKEKESPVGGG